MGLSVDQMRNEIIKLYPGKWVDRVMNMEDNQVKAIYFRCKKDGTFNKRTAQIEKEKQEKSVQKDGSYYYQYEIFDYI